MAQYTKYATAHWQFQINIIAMFVSKLFIFNEAEPASIKLVYQLTQLSLNLVGFFGPQVARKESVHHYPDNLHFSIH